MIMIIKKLNILFIYLFVSACFLLAQWPRRQSDSPIYIGDNNGSVSHISDGFGGVYFCFSWDDYSNPFLHNIGVQRVNKFGYVAWDNFVCPGSIHGEDTLHFLMFQGEERLAQDNYGGLFLLYSDAIYDSFSFEFPLNYYEVLYIQHLDSSGNKLWGEWGIPITHPSLSFELGEATGVFSSARIVSDEEGGVYVVWMDRRKDGFKQAPYIQHIDYWGNKLWDEWGYQLFEIDSTYKLPNMGQLSAVTDNEQGIIVGYNGHYFNKVSSSFEKQWGENGIEITSHGWGLICSDNKSGAFLEYEKSWTNYEAGNIECSYYLQRIDQHGGLLWGNEGIVLFDSVPDPTFSYMITKTSTQDGGCCVIYNDELIRIDSSGNENFRLLKSDLHLKTVLSSTNNNVILLASLKDTYNYYYAFSVDKNGNNLWGEDGILLGTQDIEIVITDTKGGAIFCGDEEAFQVNVNGEFGQVITAIKNNKTTKVIKEYELYQNYPNPFNPATTIHFFNPCRADVKIFIYDIIGHLIYTKYLKDIEPGYHQIDWEAKDNQGNIISSGFYILKISVNGIIKQSKMIKIK